MTTIELKYSTATFFKIIARAGVIHEMSEAFTFTVPGYKFMKKYKMGLWDGKIRMVNMRNNTVHVGLLKDIVSFCQEREYKLKLDSTYVSFLKEEVGFSWEELKLAFEPRDFQENAVNLALRHKRLLLLSSTGSGKSLIIYALTRALTDAVDGQPGLIVVPSISLVEQLTKDFDDYAKNLDWFTEDHVQRIRGGMTKEVSKPIVISTWQSLYKMNHEYLSQFAYVIGDEVHTYQATACSQLFEKCTSAHFRIGLTGTLQDSKTSEMMLKGLFGPVHQVSKTRDLMDRKILADLKIKALVLHHDKETEELARKATYQEEMHLLVSSEKRNMFLARLAKQSKGNTLLLFQYVEKHGKVLEKLISRIAPDKQVFLIFGGTDVEQRERVRQITERCQDVVIIASYGTFQQGINIVNLNNIILGSPTKSKVRLLQSIGRGLRRGADKFSCLVIDIADDLAPSIKTKNHTLKHFFKRYDYYIQEGFDVKIKSIQL